MKVLAFGINPSKRDPNAKHFDSNTEPDLTVRKSFSHIFGTGNYNFSDILDIRESDSRKILENENKLFSLFLNNRDRLTREIKDNNPDLIVWMFADKNLHSILQEFSLEFEKFPEQIIIYQPSAARRRGMIGKKWMKYAEHIQTRLKSLEKNEETKLEEAKNNIIKLIGKQGFEKISKAELGKIY